MVKNKMVFKIGHLAWNKGKKLSDSHKEKIKLNHKGMSGKHHSETTIQKMRERMKNHWLGNKNPTKNIDWEKKRIKALKGIHSSPKTEFKNGHPSHNKDKHLSETTKEKLRDARLRQILPTKDTSIELILQNRLKDLKIPFEKHKAILNLTQPDIFIEPSICIYADGCYWHGCEKCFDRNKFDAIQRGHIVQDLLITQKLQNEGYKVLRFWQHDINKNLEDKVLDEIIFTLNENKMGVDKILQV